MTVSWTFPLVLLATGLLLLLLALGLRQDYLTTGGIAVGTAMFLMVAVFVTLLTILIWRVGTLWAPARFNSWLTVLSPTPSAWLFFGSFAALALAVFSYRYQRALQREWLPDLVAGVLLNWLFALLLLTLATPGNGYLFLWPLLAALPFLAWNIFGETEVAVTLSRPGWALALLAAAVTLYFWIPFLIRFFRAQALSAFFLLPGAVVFLIGMLLPLLSPLLRRDRGILSELSLLAGLLFFAAGLWWP